MHGQDSERMVQQTMSSSSDESSIDLSLSCSFSDAESSASDPDGSLESASDAVVEPYMYEPLASDHDSASGGDDISAVEDESEDSGRLLDTNW